MRAEIACSDILRRYDGPAIGPLLSSAIGVLVGMLIDPVLLVIEALAFGVSWAIWCMIERKSFAP